MYDSSQIMYQIKQSLVRITNNTKKKNCKHNNLPCWILPSAWRPSPSLLGYLLISCDGVCKNPQLHSIETVIILLSWKPMTALRIPNSEHDEWEELLVRWLPDSKYLSHHWLQNPHDLLGSSLPLQEPSCVMTEYYAILSSASPRSPSSLLTRSLKLTGVAGSQLRNASSKMADWTSPSC